MSETGFIWGWEQTVGASLAVAATLFILGVVLWEKVKTVEVVYRLRRLSEWKRKPHRRPKH